MKVKIYIIRHGQTEENKLGIYIGARYDVKLCEEGIKEVKDKADYIRKFIGNDSFKLYVSPMIRCKETASLLFPNKEMTVEQDFKESDFGRFEGKNYEQLSNDLEYQEWIDSNGKLPFPGGESVEEFMQRNAECIKRVLEKSTDGDTLVIAAHGGTVMALMSFFTGGNYYSFKVANVDGYKVELESVDGKMNVLSFERIFKD